MAGHGLIRAQCPHCEKKIGVRPDQLGRSLRCPACQRPFTIDRPPTPTPQPSPAPAEPDPVDDPNPNWIPAGDANEIAPIGTPPGQTWQRAKFTNRFLRPKALVFQAAVQAVRGSRCEIVQIDWNNAHLRFSVPVPQPHASLHELFVFDVIDDAAEVEISSDASNVGGHFDTLYVAIIREIEKYLMFVPAPLPAPLPPPPPPPFQFVQQPDRWEDDELPRRRRYQNQGSQGLGIAGFVCALIGLCLFCIPWLGGLLGMLGFVFGMVGLATARGSKQGFATAAVILGILACVLSLTLVLFMVQGILRT